MAVTVWSAADRKEDEEEVDDVTVDDEADEVEDEGAEEVDVSNQLTKISSKI